MKWDLITSTTALQYDSTIVQQLDILTIIFYRLHEYDVRGISKFLIFPFRLMEETLIYILYKVIQRT